MGLYYNDGSDLQMISGRGKAEYGASTVRKGTYSFANTSEKGWRYATVTFDIPMVDTDYEIILTPSVGTTSAQAMATAYTIDNKTTNGFRISYYDTTTTSNVGGNYTAFKLYTDNEYNGLLNNQRYSIDEVDTGKTWINGKKIYRKIVNCGAGPAAGATKTVNHNIANIERFTHLEMIGDNNTNYWTIPWFDNNRKWWWYANRTTIYIISGASSDATSYNHLAILEYTKTTN